MKKEREGKKGFNRRDFVKIAFAGLGVGAGMKAGLGKAAFAGTKKLKFTFACYPHDRMQALMSGEVDVEGVDLNFLPMEIEEVFWRQLRHQEFDGSELSFSSYTMARSRGDETYIAIPVFPLRMFRHSYAFINVKKGINKPEDLKGKTVGVPEYQQSAGLWLRGALQHEYGVYPRDIKWRAGGLEQPGREEKLRLQLPPDVDYQSIPRDKTLSRMLDAGEIDALFTALPPSCFEKGSPNVKRLFENYPEAEKQYYLKTKIFPIMHVVAIKRSVYKENPWLAMSLYKAFVKSKDIAMERVRYGLLPWSVWEMDRTKQIMGDDWWPYGINKSRQTIEALCQYSFEQGLSAKKMTVEDLFAPETFDEFKH